MGKDTGMNGSTHITHSAEETRALGAALACETKPGSVIALRGDLGAGKTTFVQGFLDALGAEGPYVSPTFVIMKQYDLPETLRVSMRAGLPESRSEAGLAETSAGGIRRIYHVDAYRLETPDAIARIGWEEWCADDEGIVLVEWPEKIEGVIPASATTVSLRWISDMDREIVIS